jgi:hypothetical protein
MPEDRPLFTYRLVLDGLTPEAAVFTFGRDFDDGRVVRLTIPREDWEATERLPEVEVDLRARPPETP